MLVTDDRLARHLLMRYIEHTELNVVRLIEFIPSLLCGKLEPSTLADVQYRSQVMCNRDDRAWHIGIPKFE